MLNPSSEVIVEIHSIFHSNWYKYLLFFHQDRTKLEDIFVTWVSAFKYALTAAYINFVSLHLNYKVLCSTKLWHGVHYQRATKWAMMISGGCDTMGIPFLYNSVQFPLVWNKRKGWRKQHYTTTGTYNNSTIKGKGHNIEAIVSTEQLRTKEPTNSCHAIRMRISRSKSVMSVDWNYWNNPVSPC